MCENQAFGPIMPIMQFSTDEEVIKLANDSRYALGCAVFSGSKHRAKQIASQIQCGVAAINDFASNYMCQVLLTGFTLGCYLWKREKKKKRLAIISMIKSKTFFFLF